MKHHDELEADLAQYYHLDLERMGADYSCAHAACLAAQLPKGSRCKALNDPHDEWSEEMWALWRIEQNIGLLRWGFVNYEGEEAPSPMPYPGQERDKALMSVRFEANRSAVDRAFGMNGGETDG